MNEQHSPGTPVPPNHIEVAVVTTSGSYPKKGYVAVPIHQKVEELLKTAAKTLELTDTAGWIAKVGGREITSSKSYVENHLSGKVDIDWGPRESGGGAR